MEQIINTPQVIIKFREDGIMLLHYKDGILNLEESKQIFKKRRENCPWEVSPIYAAGNTFSALDKEARFFWGVRKLQNIVPLSQC